MRLLIFAAAAIAALSQGISANEHVIAYHINYVVPNAATLTERLKEVDVVAVVRIAGSSRSRAAGVSLRALAKNEDVIPDAELPPVVLTEQTAEVIEVLKTSSRSIVAGEPVTLLQHGGEAAWHERLVRTYADVPMLTPGAAYLVFLNYNDASAGLMVSPFDVFRVDRGLIEATAGPGTKYAMPLVGLRPDDAFAIVRRALVR